MKADRDLPGAEGGSRPRHSQTKRRWIKAALWLAYIVVFPILIGAIAASLLLNSGAGRRYLLSEIQSQASDALGVGVKVENFSLHLSTLSVDLYGISVDGAKPYASPPLLQVQHAQAGIGVTSFLHGKWYLENVQIDRPVAQVVVDKNGVSNIPKINSSSNSRSHTTVFDLGIRHAVLDGGEVYYNDQPSALAVDLHNLEFHAAFSATAQRYSGNLTYTNGQVAYGSMRPPAHDVDLQFEATPTTFQLKQARIASGKSELKLGATLMNYSDPSIDAHFDAIVDGGEVATILHSASIPTGLLHANGTATYHQIAGHSALEGLVAQADIDSHRLKMKTAAAQGAIDNFAAHLSVAHGDAVLKNVRGAVFGGELTAEGTMTNLAGDSATHFDGALHNVSLAQLRRAVAPSAQMSNVDVSGALNVGVTASWGKTIDNLVAKADVDIDGQVAKTQVGDKVIAVSDRPVAKPAGPMPVKGSVHAVYTNKDGQLKLDRSYLRTPQTDLTLDGVVSKKSSVAIHLRANDLVEVEAIANLFRSPVQGKAPAPLGLAGTATFDGNVKGPLNAPDLTGHLAASNLRLNGSEWKSIRTNVEVTPSVIRLQQADVAFATRGHVTLDASVALDKWSYKNTSPMQAKLAATQIDIAELMKLAGQQLPVTGTLDANMDLHGSEVNPQGRAQVTLTKVTAYEEPVRSIQLDAIGSGDEAHGNLSVHLGAGTVQSTFSVRPKERTYRAQLTSSGLDLAKLNALKTRNVDATGTIQIRADGQGSFDNPQLNANLAIPTLNLRGQTISGLNLQANVANHAGEATLRCSAVNSALVAKAKVNLTGDYVADATVDTQPIPFAPLLAAYAPDSSAGISGQTEVHATLHGPLKRKELVEAHVEVPVLKMDYNNSIHLAAAAPIHVDYKNGVVEVRRSAIRGTDTDLEFQGSIPTAGNEAMSLLLQGTVDLHLAQLFEPGVRSSGKLKFDINSYGAASGPDVGGKVDVVDANYASEDLPFGLEHGNGVLTLTKNRMTISKFEGTVGGGKVTAQGGVAFQPSLQFDMGVAAKDLRILYPQGMRESVDANLRLAGTTENAALSGAVNLSNLSFTPGFDLPSFIGQFSGDVSAPPTRGFSQNVALNIAVNSTNNVNLTSSALSINGAANLQVRGTASDPVILGRVSLNGGDIILNGNRFVLSGGTVQFINPMRTEPVVNLALNTTIEQYSIDLKFNGPVDQLRTQYSSDPSLPQAEIIHLLALGTTTQQSAQQSVSAMQTGENLVASQVTSQVTSRISKIAGISQLSINPVLASGAQSSPGANITIQQRVTGNLFITFSSNLATSQGQTMQGQYQVTPRVAVSATRDPNGGFAVDTLVKKSW
jgi:translocation and assembly module TamB